MDPRGSENMQYALSGVARGLIVPSRAFSGWGVITHVYVPNRSTSCTTATQNLPAVLLSATSLPKPLPVVPTLPAPAVD